MASRATCAIDVLYATGVLYCRDLRRVARFHEAGLRLLSDDEYAEFQAWLAANPRAGDVIRDTGGLRKVRWSCGGKGKRSGVRVIYYHLDELAQIRLLLIYRKGIKDDISAKEKLVLREIKARWIP